MDIRKLQKIVINALETVKARDIENFDVKHITAMFDRVIIASTDSARQAKAMVNHLREDIREVGGKIHGVEGEESGEWVLVDLGDIVVHVMQVATREHYKLEELWNQPKPRAPRKSVKPATTAKSAAKPQA
ncbi:MAG: ribosome silencing factor [Betaproteobacteria bacterium]|nr:ribosome silencing factor [Betaproteobacteria bacterium]